MNYPEELKDLCLAVVPVGSQVTCNPPPPLEDSDIDLLCFVDYDDYDDVCASLEDQGWDFTPEYKGMSGDFLSYRKDVIGADAKTRNYNVILTCNGAFFEDFMDATKVCKEANYLHKQERIECFNNVFKRKREERNPWKTQWNKGPVKSMAQIYQELAAKQAEINWAFPQVKVIYDEA